LLRPIGRPRFRRERVDTPDGDFLDLDWCEPEASGAPVVVVLHGLEGSSRSHYVSGLCREAVALGLRAVILNFRSCSGELNRTARLYHSGETSDLDAVLGRVIGREPAVRVGLVGISLGGNVLLKWLGERGARAHAQERAAAAISRRSTWRRARAPSTWDSAARSTRGTFSAR
jgi:predicted alpha/beta-fold hydrolase